MEISYEIITNVCVSDPMGLMMNMAEKENKMELFHNQVTREQGIFSYRFNHGSQGLYIFWPKMLICQRQYWIFRPLNALSRN